MALDDFGTGYSSLNYLRNLPVDVLKIDRGFILDLANDDKQQGIVSAIVELAKQLGLHVVAEGVEDEEQILLLRGFDCDEAQGYFYSPPLEEEEFRAFVHSHTPFAGESQFLLADESGSAQVAH